MRLKCVDVCLNGPFRMLAVLSLVNVDIIALLLFDTSPMRQMSRHSTLQIQLDFVLTSHMRFNSIQTWECQMFLHPTKNFFRFVNENIHGPYSCIQYARFIRVINVCVLFWENPRFVFFDTSTSFHFVSFHFIWYVWIW